MNKLSKYRGLALVLVFVTGGVFAPPAHAILMMMPEASPMAHHGQHTMAGHAEGAAVAEPESECPYLELFETVDKADSAPMASTTSCDLARCADVARYSDPIQCSSTDANPDRGPPTVLPIH